MPDPRDVDCDDSEPTSPLDEGARILACAETAVHATSRIHVAVVSDEGAQAVLDAAGATLPAGPEAYAVVAGGGGTLVVGSDPVGAMYGAYDVAERLRAGGPTAMPPPTPIVDAPAVAVRGANLFLILPTDEDPPGDWWFLDDDFWTDYLELLARARIDFLDLHGMYNPKNTIFPNALLYFGDSASEPDLGAPAAERARNRAMLAKIVARAAARGIRVGLMTYRSDTSLDGNPVPPVDDMRLRRYTREAAESVARGVPGLWRMGFRVGESGKDVAWYSSSFVAGVQAAGANVHLYTRTWGTSKPEVMALAQASHGDLLVEAKYNGEHLGAPWPVAGGPFAGPWRNYSYEDYLDAPAPYDFVFQIRAGGTHRAFRQPSLARARETIASVLAFGARGFSLEAGHAYLSQRDALHASAADAYSPWTFRRDELTYLLFGRLAYDPATDEGVFRRALADRVGTDALWAPLQAAAEVVPWIQTARTCGPDQRDFAPELEWGGTVAYWARSVWALPEPHACQNQFQGPFDGFVVASPYEAADDLDKGRRTARISPVDVALRVEAAAAAARSPAVLAEARDAGNAEARDVARECIAVGDLGEYFGHKLRAATALAVYVGGGPEPWHDVARAETELADAAWRALADDTTYVAPFFERLRMGRLGLGRFHWRDEVPWLDADLPSVDAALSWSGTPPKAPPMARALPDPRDWLWRARAVPPSLASLGVARSAAHPAHWLVDARLGEDLPPGSSVRALWKPLAGTTDWRFAPMRLVDGAWQGEVGPAPDGGLFAIEVRTPDAAWRLPDPDAGVPYVVRR